MGFWADVRELRARIQKHVSQGAGRASLIKAIDEGPLGEKTEKPGKVPGGAGPPEIAMTKEDVAALVEKLPDRMSHVELQELLKAGIPVKGMGKKR